MVDYIEKGGLYDVETDAPDFGLAGRAQSWSQAQNAIKEMLDLQARGQLGGPVGQLKLRVWKNRQAPDWPWCIKWVPVDIPEEETWNARTDAP